MKNSRSFWGKSRLLAALTVMPALVIAQESQEISVFDVEQHPESPSHSAIYPDAKIPLDAQVSWTNRFKGNEEFNEAETLASNMMDSDESGLSLIHI